MHNSVPWKKMNAITEFFTGEIFVHFMFAALLARLAGWLAGGPLCGRSCVVTTMLYCF